MIRIMAEWICLGAAMFANLQAECSAQAKNNVRAKYSEYAEYNERAEYNQQADNVAHAVQDYEPFYLRVRHRRNSEFFVKALYDPVHNHPLIPIAELLDHLEIYYTQTKGDCESCMKLKGRFLTNGVPFQIDAGLLLAKHNLKDIELRIEDATVMNGKIFLTPSVLSRIFAVPVRYLPKTLTLTLSVDRLYPYEERLMREYRRSVSEVQDSKSIYMQNTQSQLGSLSDMKILDGGVLDYQIQQQMTRNFQTEALNYLLKGGFELLGGSVWMSRSGMWMNRSGGLREEWNGQWTMNLTGKPWISSISAGTLTAGGVIRSSMVGFSVSNHPISKGTLFGFETVSGKTRPDADVDLYLQNRIVAYGTTDQGGRYSFKIPLMYGRNTIVVETITNEGESLLHSKQIQIPQRSIRKGSFLYELQAGRTVNQPWVYGRDGSLLHLSVITGVSNRQTIESEFDWRGERGVPEWIRMEWTARLLQQQFVSVEWIHGHRIRTGWRTTLRSGSTISVSYTGYRKRSAINTARLKRRADVQWNQTLNAGSLPISIQTGLDVRETERVVSTGVRTSIFLQSGRFQWGSSFLYRFECRFQACLEQQVSWRITGRYRIPNTQSLPHLLRSWNIRSSLSGAGRKLPVRGLDVRITRQKRAIGINLGWSYQFRTEQSAFQMGIQMRLANRVKMRSNMQVREDGIQSSQAFSGSIGYDSSSNRFFSMPEPGVGYAGLSVLLFQDRNSNGTYEKSVDELLPYAAIRISNQTNPELGEDGVVRFSRLPQHKTLEVEVVSSKLPDPLLIPAQTVYSLTTRTNRYQELQIPFYYGGWIEGVVQIVGADDEGHKNYEEYAGDAEYAGDTEYAGDASNSAQIPLSGLTLELWMPPEKNKKHLWLNLDKRTIPIFRDGSFYAEGLLPGIYHLRPEDKQLEELNLKFPDAWIEFRIEDESSTRMPGPLRLILRQKM